ncbi:MAG: PIN domain-containing protein [Tepidisphaeraceae bacterium]
MSRRRVLDTNVLIRGWHRSASRPLANASAEDARSWARKIIDLYRSDAIVTPVDIEFRAAARSQHELVLARSFLAVFRIVDDGRVTIDDWSYARRLAEHARPKPRQLGDCLVRALSNRAGYDVETLDGTFPRQL